jgi:hypothetical protein
MWQVDAGVGDRDRGDPGLRAATELLPGDGVARLVRG